MEGLQFKVGKVDAELDGEFVCLLPFFAPRINVDSWLCMARAVRVGSSPAASIVFMALMPSSILLAARACSRLLCRDCLAFALGLLPPAMPERKRWR